MTRGIRGMTRFFDRQDVFYRTSSFFETAVRKKVIMTFFLRRQPVFLGIFVKMKRFFLFRDDGYLNFPVADTFFRLL